MLSTNRVQHTCPFCGDNYYVTHTSDDGRDWLGHARGRSQTYPPKGECLCDTAQVLKKIKVKPMCLNCKFFAITHHTCTNEIKMEEAKKVLYNIQVRVDVTTLKIENEKSNCPRWKFDSEHITDYLEMLSLMTPLEKVDTSPHDPVDPKMLFRKHNGRTRK